MMHMQSQHKIGVNLAPNYEIVKYAPYLIKENILNAVKEITKLQLSCSFKLTDYVILNFGEKSMQGLDSNPELQCMLIEAITESSRVLATTGIQLHVSVAPKYDRVIP